MREATDGASAVREIEVRSVWDAVVSGDTFYSVTFYAQARLLVLLSSSLNAQQ